MKNYVPQGIRRLAPKQEIKLPKRLRLNNDENLTNYYRECLLVTSQAAQYYAENLLDSEINFAERILIQTQKDALDKICFGIADQLTPANEEKHYNRIDFVVEMVKLATLVKPTHFKLIQGEMVKQIKKTRKI